MGDSWICDKAPFSLSNGVDSSIGDGDGRELWAPETAKSAFFWLSRALSGILLENLNDDPRLFCTILIELSELCLKICSISHLDANGGV